MATSRGGGGAGIRRSTGGLAAMLAVVLMAVAGAWSMFNAAGAAVAGAAPTPPAVSANVRVSPPATAPVDTQQQRRTFKPAVVDSSANAVGPSEKGVASVHHRQAATVLRDHYGPMFGMSGAAAATDTTDGDDDSNAVWLTAGPQHHGGGGAGGPPQSRFVDSRPLRSDGTVWRTSLRRLVGASSPGVRISVEFRLPGNGGYVAKEGCEKKLPSSAWTRDSDLARVASAFFGPRWIEAAVTGTGAGSAAAAVFLRPTGPCRYEGTFATAEGGGDFRLAVRMLYGSYDHVNERTEEAPLRHLEPVAADAELVVPPGEYTFTLPSEPSKATSSAFAAAGWLATGADRVNHKSKAAPLNGYWLPVKGEAPDASRVSFTPDILGRMNYGLSYRHRSRLASADACKVDSAAVSPSDATRNCLLERLRGRTINFIGDSHMRIFFYGFLAALKIPFPPNKVWRGDRTDVVASHNVTVKFIASYFLNLTKPSAQEMLRGGSGGGDDVIVAGVGQHHSCHCWSVAKHMAVVSEALDELMKPQSAPASRGGRRHVVWFGIPAQPMNRHLHMAKPTGQNRRDCRNNARHLLYSAYQKALVDQLSATASAGEGPVVSHVDAFQLSVGMEHTSLDGAHFYTWARDAWIEALSVELLRSSKAARK